MVSNIEDLKHLYKITSSCQSNPTTSIEKATNFFITKSCFRQFGNSLYGKSSRHTLPAKVMKLNFTYSTLTRF